MSDTTEVLVIPDPHDSPSHNKDRFEWAGEFALKRQPSYIVCLGDWAEMGSLGDYERGCVSMEGLRYCDDIASSREALARFNQPIEEYNNRHTRWKKKKYLPKKVMCYGNHEERILRAANKNPSMYGTIQLEDLGYEEAGWETFSLTKPAVIEGISFSHYFTSGIMGRPISGVNHARSLILKCLGSSVVGHSHLRGMAEERSISGKQMLGLVCGCYFDYDMGWSTENGRYWRGLVYLHDVHDGMAEPEFLNLNTYLKVKYGK
jgi:predicted phosphodiesterase